MITPLASVLVQGSVGSPLHRGEKDQDVVPASGVLSWASRPSPSNVNVRCLQFEGLGSPPFCWTTV